MADIHRTARAKEQGRAEGYARRAGYKHGGGVHADEAQDKRLIAKMIGEEEKREGKRPKRKRGGKVGGGAVAMRLDKKPRKNGDVAVYDAPGRTDVQKPKLTETNIDKIEIPKRATGGKITPKETGLQGHNGMGKLANLGKYAHGGKIKKIQKREGGGDVGMEDMPSAPMREDVAVVPPMVKPGGGLGNMRGPGMGAGRMPPGLGRISLPGNPGAGMKRPMPLPSEPPMMEQKRGGKVKRASGGRVKKPTVNVIVNTAPKQDAGADPAKALMSALASAKPPMPPPPAIPPGGPVPPMGGPPGPGLPPGMGAPPPMMRKTGGRIPMAKMGPATIPVSEKISVKGYQRRKGGKVC